MQTEPVRPDELNVGDIFVDNRMAEWRVDAVRRTGKKIYPFEFDCGWSGGVFLGFNNQSFNISPNDRFRRKVA